MQLRAQPLEGRVVRLEPVVPAMREEMRAALDGDPEAWALQVTNGSSDGFSSYWDAMCGQSDRIAFGVRLRSTGALVGTTSFAGISSLHRKVEIGWTYLRPEARGTAINPEVKLLMLEYAFASGALRIQLRTDSRNLRSQAAIAKLGAVREGVLRRHRITWTGHLRDTVVFSIIDTDWPAVRERLIERLRIATV